MIVTWTEDALDDLAAIRTYIEERNPQAAARVAAAIRSSVGQLAEVPALGRPGRVAGTRELVIPSLPFIVAYTATEGRVEILAVLHAARRWPEAF